MKILILSNIGMGLYKFRKELLEKLSNTGHKVYLSFPCDEYVPQLQDLGCEYIETNFNRRGKNSISDIKLLINYYKIIKKVKPDIVLTYTIKPNIYGGIVCRLSKTPYLTNITGLGTSIENSGLLQIILLTLYKIALKKSSCIFFQNESNKRLFLQKNITGKKDKLVPGSGVNLDYHKFEEYTAGNKELTFLFIGRIMKAKGIDELLEAAEKIKQTYDNVRFNIIGGFDEDYSIKINEYAHKNIINYLGHQNDVRPFIKESHALINPSYHEGTSNVLLEAAAAGRPVLASNVPGCKETFDEGISGVGFESKSEESLYNAIVKFIDTPYEQKRSMGIAGRRKVEKEYDRNIVINEYIKEINKAGK